MKPFLLNTRSGVLHDVRHSNEQCNTDDIEPEYRDRLTAPEVAGVIMADKRIWDLCRHCWPDKV